MVMLTQPRSTSQVDCITSGRWDMRLSWRIITHREKKYLPAPCLSTTLMKQRVTHCYRSTREISRHQAVSDLYMVNGTYYSLDIPKLTNLRSLYLYMCSVSRWFPRESFPSVIRLWRFFTEAGGVEDWSQTLWEPAGWTAGGSSGSSRRGFSSEEAISGAGRICGRSNQFFLEV